MKMKGFLLLLVSFYPLHADFTGTLVFQQTAEGEQAEMVLGFAPQSIIVHIASNAYRQDEGGGVKEGSYIVREGSNAALKLNHSEKTSALGNATAMDELEDVVKAFIPQNFNTELESTGKTETLAMTSSLNGAESSLPCP